MQLNDNCAQMFAGLAYQTDLSKIAVHRSLDARLPPIMADPHQLLQALMNIALNACRTITSGRDGSRLTVDTKWTDGVIKVAIEVSGLGFATDHHDGLLYPLSTIREDTGGLGPSFAHRVIRNHGGRLVIHNIPGEVVTYLEV
jgi:nitrogen-specific signal transduction histidine kinase